MIHTNHLFNTEFFNKKEFSSFIAINYVCEDEKLDCQKIFQYLKNGFGSNAYQRFLKHIKYCGLKFNKDAMLLAVPNKFIKGIILQTYFKDIASFVYHNCKLVKKIELTIIKNIANNHSFNHSDTFNAVQSYNKRFDNFICGDSNKFAYLSAKQVAEMISHQNYIPSFCIFGPVGMGKTHLLQSIIHHVRTYANERKIEYISAEKFKELYNNYTYSNRLYEFKKKFSELEVLLLDDVQFIYSMNDDTKREFTKIINHFIDDNKCVIITCDRPPSNLNIDYRTKSRVSSGLKACISQSDMKLRMMILQYQLKYRYETAYEISHHLLEHIARNVVSSIRELESILQNIISYATITKVNTINDSLVYDIIKNCDFRDQIQPISNYHINCNQIIEVVCKFYGVNIDDIFSSMRTKRISYARASVAYIARNMYYLTYKEIGLLLNRNHSTIIYLINLIEANDKLRNETSALQLMLNKFDVK